MRQRVREVGHSYVVTIPKGEAKRLGLSVGDLVNVELTRLETRPSLNPELRVKAARGPAKAVLQQEGYTPVLIKVINDSAATRPLRITSAQAATRRFARSWGKCRHPRSRPPC